MFRMIFVLLSFICCGETGFGKNKLGRSVILGFPTCSWNACAVWGF